MKCAIVTMSYKNDFEECRLLCESIDRYVPKDVYHYIFVRDSDLKFFKSLESGRRIILPESSVLSWWFFSLPFRFMRHYFRIGLFTMPVRGWIVQQIVKLSVWKAIDARFDIFLNVDSECVFMKPFNPNVLLNEKGKLGIYREKMNRKGGRQESLLQAHKQFCGAAKRLLGLNETVEEIGKYYYIASVVAFRRDTLMDVCSEIGKHHWSRNYQIALMNTYRFSEYFLYANYVYHKSELKGHFELKKDYFLMLKYPNFVSKEKLKEEIDHVRSMHYGIWFQKKGTRHRHEQSAITFPDLKQIIYELWDNPPIKE